MVSAQYSEPHHIFRLAVFFTETVSQPDCIISPHLTLFYRSCILLKNRNLPYSTLQNILLSVPKPSWFVHRDDLAFKQLLILGTYSDSATLSLVTDSHIL